MSKITFRIKRSGEVTADVNGSVGTACKDLTKPFLDALGTITAVEEKEEAYDQIDAIYVEVEES